MFRRRPPTPRLSCPTSVWTQLHDELRRRGGGRREAGAFLLGERLPDGGRRIREVVYYDDVDPNALRGAIVFDGSRMDQVWDHCARSGLSVVADVHTHPGGYGQSHIDQANPMLPEAGHLAMIIPNFAARTTSPGELGIYEYRGAEGWLDHSRRAGFLKIGG